MAVSKEDADKIRKITIGLVLVSSCFVVQLKV